MHAQRVSLFGLVGGMLMVGGVPTVGAQEVQTQLAAAPATTHVITQGAGMLTPPTESLVLPVALQPIAVQADGVEGDVAPMPVFPSNRMSFEQLRRRLPYGVTQNLVIRYLGDDVEFMTHDD